MSHIDTASQQTIKINEEMNSAFTLSLPASIKFSFIILLRRITIASFRDMFHTSEKVPWKYKSTSYKKLIMKEDSTALLSLLWLPETIKQVNLTKYLNWTFKEKSKSSKSFMNLENNDSSSEKRKPKIPLSFHLQLTKNHAKFMKLCWL